MKRLFWVYYQHLVSPLGWRGMHMYVEAEAVKDAVVQARVMAPKRGRTRRYEVVGFHDLVDGTWGPIQRGTP
jgi:hypothetical protein